MLSIEPAISTLGLVPASRILPGLGQQFDLSTAAEFTERYHAIQSGGSSPTWSYRASDGSNISLFHDTPLLRHTDYDKAPFLFPEGVNGYRDQIVIDLGAGQKTDGYLFARDLGARAYIAVEFCFTPMLARNLEELAPQERKVPCAVIYDSIEQVLPAIPQHSASFICAGIDDTFRGFDTLRTSISQHIPHALHRHGAFLLYTPVSGQFTLPGLQNASQLPNVPVWIAPS